MDGLEGDAHGLVTERLVPIRRPLVPVVELLQELRSPRVVGHLIAPPDGGGDVVGGGLELIPRLALRTPRAIRDHLVAHARLRVLAVHGDVIGQVGIDQDDVRVQGLQTIQHGLEVLAVQIERLVHHDLPRGAAPRSLAGEVLDGLRVFLAVRGLLPDDGDARRRGQLSVLLLLLRPAHQCVPELLDRGLEPEQMLEPALVQRLAGAGRRDVGDVELLGDGASFLHQR